MNRYLIHDLFPIFFMKSIGVDYYYGMMIACRMANKNMAQTMIEIYSSKTKGDRFDSIWCWGLMGACQSGHREVAEWTIEKGAYNFNIGLYEACLAGMRDLAELMIQLGADDFDQGLIGACRAGHRYLVNLMIQQGATPRWCLSVTHCHPL